MPNNTMRTSPGPPEDVRQYLPVKPVARFHKRRIIYDERQPSSGLYSILEGRVKVVIPGAKTLANVFGVNDIFGESSLVSTEQRSECVTALEDVAVMSWTVEEIRTYILQQPKLGIALLQQIALHESDHVE